MRLASGSFPRNLGMPKGELAVAVLVGLAVGTLFQAPSGPGPNVLPRLALALATSICLLLISLRSPQAAVVLCMAFLGVLGLTRRLLIPAAGWSSYDPLLLVGPLVSIVLCIRLFALQKRPLARDRLSILVLLLLLTSLFESLNPSGGNVAAGLVGLLFVAAPLIWFLVGREVDGIRLSTILSLVLLVGTVTAVYGLGQSFLGMPSWDASWVQLNGYAALNVGGAIRAFGTFASSAEYAAYLGAAVIVGMVALLRGRLIAVVPLPVIGLALFLDSSRGVFILTLCAAIVIIGLGTGRWSLAIVAIAGGAIIITGSILLLGSQLTKVAVESGNPFIAHQVSGLANPLDPNASTLLLHLQIVGDGINNALDHPLGLGTAATNIATQDPDKAASTELDISNAFLSLGLVGGMLFVSVVLIAFRRITNLAILTRDPDILAVVGILIVTLGQWLNGGYYAVAPLLWFLIGATTRRWLERRSQPDRLARPVGDAA
jgi:hypothetical protein